MTPQQQIPSAPVTLLDVYTRQIEMTAALSVINERLNAIPDHESRIRNLEAFRGKVAGVAIAAGVAAGIVTDLIAGHLH